MLAELTTEQQTLQQTQLGIQGSLELILDRLTALERPPANPNGGGLLPMPMLEARQNRQARFTVPPPKRELPSFEGKETRYSLENASDISTCIKPLRILRLKRLLFICLSCLRQSP